MKLLLITLFALSSLAQDPSKKSNQKDPRKEKMIVSDLKVKEIDNAISKEAEFQKCKEMTDKSKIPECISKIVDTFDESKLDAIQKDLGESAFKVEGGKRSEAIKEFMQARISKLIYGDEKDEDKSKPPKVVGHGAYREIYKSQLGKNMLLDINTYCLENIGSSNPESILNVKLNASGDVESFDYSTLNPTTGEPSDILVGETEYKDLVMKTFEYTRGDVDINLSEKISSRKTETLKKLKKASLKIYSVQGKGEKAGNICRSILLPMMCERYKCNSTKQIDLDATQEKKCEDIYSITSKSNDKNGQIACSLLSKLESYKKAFVNLESQKEFFDKEKSTSGFSNVTESVDPEYDTIDKMTSVGSKELSNEVDEIKNIEESTKKIQEECIDKGDTESDLCKGLATNLSDDDEESADFENALADAIYQKKVDLAKEGGEGELRKFLEENGLLAKYADKIGSIKDEELAKIIKNDYKAKKDSLNETMMAKLKALRGTKNTDNTNGDYNKSETIEKKNNNLEDDKEYIETMYEYNNIVTSYLSLTVKDSSGKVITDSTRSFGQGKNAELEAIDKYKNTLTDPKEIEEYEKYKDMFSSSEKESSGSNNAGDSVNFISFLDSVLGTPDPKTK